jgi:sterol desaturase/sphingolipid hydroxylase (fatty acid hydroxylase superfamily)
MNTIPVLISILLTSAYFTFKIPKLSSYSANQKNNIYNHWASNFSLEVINQVISFVFIQIFSRQISQTILNTPQELTLKSIALTLFCVFLLDFTFYWRHRFYHRFLMRLHKLHHQPSQFDFTLSFRVHPLEMIIQILIFLSVIYLFNLDYWQVTCINVIFTTQALLSHIEYDILPNNLKKYINLLFVTPQFHEQHHQKTGNQHYGFLFNIWDSLFLTANNAKDT